MRADRWRTQRMVLTVMLMNQGGENGPLPTIWQIP